MEEEIQSFARCALTADMTEGVTAFVEKRAPRFVGQ
jgi:enoyl-CoA hydratase/carnithine racemase